MVTSIYNPYLLISTNKDTFRVVGMQTDNTLILALPAFTKLEDNELQKANLSIKPRDKLSPISKLIFNRYILNIDLDNIIILIQKD